MEALRETDPARVGPYTLTGRLGSGGMGVVYHGRDRAGVEAAVKVLRAELADAPEFRARFRREIDTLRRIGEVCRVPVLDAAVDGAHPYLATAFVPGPTLGERIHTGDLPRPWELRALGRSLALTLAAIHDEDVVHRDLKPSNIIIAPDGPRIIDFGVARLTEATLLTLTGTSIGTPGYLAPEQILGGSDAPTDIFAWGATLAHAATGEPPFGTGHPGAVIYRVLHTEPDLSAAPAWLRPALRAALRKDPARRPTAAELARSLARTPVDGTGAISAAGPVRGNGDRLPGTGPESEATVTALPTPVPPEAAARPPRARPGRAVLTAAVVAVAMLLTGGAVWATKLAEHVARQADGGARVGVGAPPSGTADRAPDGGTGAPDGAPEDSRVAPLPDATPPLVSAAPVPGTDSGGSGGEEDSEGAEEPGVADATDAPDGAGDQVTLKVTALDEASRVAVRDNFGETIYDRVLEAGQSQTFLSRSRFTVTIGNAGAVRLRVNGTDTGPAGAPGQVARFSLAPGGG